MSEAQLDAEVLVVGAGPVGLALALDLGRRGVKTLLVEAESGPVDQPGATTLTPRTVEHLHRLGLGEEVIELGLDRRRHRDVVMAEYLCAEAVTRVRIEIEEGLSPFAPLLLPQHRLVRVLRAAVDALDSVTVWHDSGFDRFRSTTGPVVTQLSTSAPQDTVRTSYVVGADGAGSTVAEAAQMASRAPSEVDERLSILFDSEELADLHPQGPFAQALLVNDELMASIRPVNDLYRYQFDIVLSEFAEPTSVDPAELLYRCVGVEFAHDVISGLVWSAGTSVASDFGAGRVMVVGDAAHRIMPSGGLSLACGIGDATNLAWKIAAVTQGWGGAELLGSYSAERRPIAVLTGEVAYQHAAMYAMVAAAIDAALDSADHDEAPDDDDMADAELDVADPGTDALAASEDDSSTAEPEADGGDEAEDALRRTSSDVVLDSLGIGEQAIDDVKVVVESEAETIGLDLGAHYGDSPICWSDGSDPPPFDVRHYVPTAHPGSRLPWLTLDDGSSLHDTIGQGMTLLRLGVDAPDGKPFVEAAQQRGVPFRVVEVAESWVSGAIGAKLVLVRPDLHVSWRASSAPADVGALIDRLRGATKPLRLVDT